MCRCIFSLKFQKVIPFNIYNHTIVAILVKNNYLLLNIANHIFIINVSDNIVCFQVKNKWDA